MLSDPNRPSGFGTIYEVDDSGTLKILKVLHNTHPKAIELFRQETEVLKQLNHPGIPKVDSDGYFTFLPRDNQKPLHCLVMEKIEGMNLEEYLSQRNYQPISERAAVRWLKQIAEILHEVHQKQYFHRDIKPSNIMLRLDGQLTLIDFGTAREVTQTYMHKVAGQQVTGIISTGYTPPEQMKGKAVPESDFFALGRTFVYLLTGKCPDDFAENPHTGELIWRDGVTDISQRLANLIDNLMAAFPGNRPKDTQEILDLLAVIEPSARATKQPVQSVQVPVYGVGNQQLAVVSGGGISKESSLAFGLFWRRFLAFIIDLLISFVLMGISIIVALNIVNKDDYELANLVMIGGWIISTWLYFALLESSTKKATLGKMALNIVVTDIKGNNISFLRASWRYLLIVFFSYFYIFFVGILVDFIVPFFLKKIVLYTK
jgi:serine/threonine protein kinase